MCLIALTLNWQLLVVILEVAIGLGMVIFVHELGHFAVAKACGVKCEKFYLGFDIYGLKLAKFQWGETEYGIGILPLGGYVKMLGQDDNPGRASEERERSKLATDEGGVAPSADAQPLDPRSYMAKSVPQRMAIISAGVIMNLIFAVVMASVAYGIGVTDAPCRIAALIPGAAAWKAGLIPGDEIIQIGDESGPAPPRFRDLTNAVVLGDMQEGVRFLIRREGLSEPFWITVKPDRSGGRLVPAIGVAAALTTTLNKEHPVLKGTPTADLNAFKPGDTIVAVGDVAVHDYAELEAQLVAHPDQTLPITVERGKEKLTIDVPPNPLKTVGLVMQMGTIAAVQKESPAAAAGLQAGDRLVSIDSQPVGDPITLPDRLRARSGETVSVTVERKSGSATETITKDISLRDAPYWEISAWGADTPLGVPVLGIAYRVLNVVVEVPADGPAAHAVPVVDGKEKPDANVKIQPGAVVVKAEFVLPPKTEAAADPDRQPSEPIKFGEDQANWPAFLDVLQTLEPGTKIRLTLSDDRVFELTPAAVPGQFNPDRGFLPEAESMEIRATSVGQAIAMGFEETRDSTAQVYRFLRKIGTQVSLKALGGPKTIAEAAGHAAYKGVSKLLIFLTMLSANLAVINFLPIPLLDGGHMVFLALEGLFRRPVNERVIVAFHYAGFVFIISLMLFVLGLDFGLIPRQP